MPVTNNLPQNARNGQPSLESRAFSVAFIPPPETHIPPNVTRAWSESATAAIATLIDFRSALHRWTMAGQVNDAEFVLQLESLDRAGLAGWLDNLIALAMEEPK